jgi:hypothetical protein
MKLKFRKLLVLLLGVAWLMPAVAQDENNVGALIKITPKDGHDEALITAITDYHKWIANFDGAMRYNWYEVLTGPDTGLYYAWSGGHSWKAFDAEYDWQPKAGEVFQTNVWPHVADMDRMMVETMNDWSHWPESWDDYTHFHLTDWYVKNGQYGKFRKGLMRIVKALKAGGYSEHWGFHSMQSGTYAGHIMLVSPTKGWAGMSEPETTFYDIMSKELGGEEAFDAFMADWGDSFRQGATMTVKWMPGASDYGDE